MKKIFLASLIIGMFMVACNKSQEGVSPSNNQKVLGLVVQAPSTQSTALILLKDGRAINPQSGFNPTQLSAGNKFVLSFQPVSTTGKIINANVTSFVAANDSAFVPPPSNSDSVAFNSAMQGTHHCTFTSAVVDYQQPADTMKIIKDFNIVVSESMFQCNATYAPVPGGSGIFYFNSKQINNVYFLNYAQLPANSTLPPGALLSGPYYYAVFDKYVVIWTYT